MASRHDIIQIDFRANAGRANKAVESLRKSAKDSRDAIVQMQKALNEGIAAGNGQDWIDKQTKKIRDAKKELKAFEKAERELVKGVDVLSRGIDAFNNGSLEKMSAAMQKAIGNAARLARSKMTPDTAQSKKDIAEMDALIMATDKNLVKSRQDFAELVNTIKTGGKTSTAELSLAKEQLKELMNLTARGTKEWKGYEAQLKAIEAKFQALTLEEQRMAGKNALKQVFSGSYVTKTRGELEKMIQTLRQYQSAIADPGGNGARHFNATERAIKSLTDQLGKAKEASATQVLGNMSGFGVEQIRQATQQMTQLRDAFHEGTTEWNKYNALVKQGDAYLKEYAEREKIARGEAISLADALKLSSKAGTSGFAGTAQQLQLAQQALERSIATTDKGTAKYQRLQQALASVKAEMAGAGISSQQMQKVLENPKAVTSVGTLKQAIARSRAEMDVMGQKLERMNQLLAQAQKNGNTVWADRLRNSIKQTSQALDQQAKSTKEADLRMKELANTSKGTTSAIDKAWSRLKTYIGLYVGAAVAMQKVSQTFGDILELSDKMGEVRKTTGFTADEVGRLTTELKKLDTRTSITGLLELSVAAGQLGLKTQEDVEGFTVAANKLMVALPEMGKEGATEMLKVALATGEIDKIRKQMELGLIEGSSATAVAMEKVGSTIDRLRATSAATAPHITDFVKRVGAVGAQSGITIDQVAALGSTVDALGMRVEMSATALSRMMPAIRNNAFDIAKILRVEPNTIRELYDTGKGMEVILMILQHIKDAGMDADSIESMLGMGGMQEIMKELNQQGARAGIVFGGLSQNVDELRRQLGVAKQAYEENIAIQQEYDKMNETAAAKWERLKNQLEEFFVGAGSTNWLSDIIDALRILADLVTDEGPLGRLTRYTIAYMAMMKTGWTQSIGNAILAVYEFTFATNKSAAATVADTAATTADTGAKAANAAATEGAAAAQGMLNKTMKANIITAVLTAIVALGWAIYDYARKVKDAAKQTDLLADVEKKAKEESVKQRAELEKLYKATQDQTKSIEERKEAFRKMVGDAKYKEYYKNLNTESGLAKAAAEAYKELAEQIIATARARALDAKAEKLQQQRIELEDQKTEKEKWRNKNQSHYESGKQSYSNQQKYVGKVTGGRTAGFQESQIAQQGAAIMKPAIIEQYESNEREIERIDSEIGQIDTNLEKLKKQIKINPSIPVGGGSGGSSGSGGSGGSGGGGDNGGWGNEVDAASTDYGTWDVTELVERRKQMNKFKNVLKPGIDVRKVLAEDKALMKAIDEGKVGADWQSVLGWYNTERKKIQEELKSERFSTNEGNWRDEKTKKGKKKKRVNIFKETDYALAELDRYYSKRKEHLEKARAEENMSEELYNREVELLEQEHLKKRSDLRRTFTADNSKEEQAMVKQFRKWWSALEKSGDLDTVPWATVESEWSKATAAQIGRNNLKAQQDLTQLQSITVKHLNAIAKLVDKERPYDGITANLRDNLTKMDILFADIQKNGPSQDTSALVKAGTERLKFLLGEAETAYSSTIEDVLRRMGEAGMTAWAEEIRKSPDMKNALMAQLQKAYDAVQEAIKKESEQIKRQTDIWWADVEKGQTQSRKGGFERMLASLGLAEDQVKRANSLIGAGQASQRVADKLAIKQMQVQLQMQQTYYLRMRQIGEERIRQLEAQGKLEDAEHLRRSLNLALTKEQSELDKQRVAIANQLEESQNRLYTELREWADLLAQSLQTVFEASAAGKEEYYNELAKLNLTGKGGPGAGTYVVIDNAGTSKAKAHYEQLDEREAIKRQREIEQENALAEAWKKVMDDLNNKMNDQITDWMNAALQNQSIDANTTAVNLETEATKQNTEALQGLTAQLAQGVKFDTGDGTNETTGDITNGPEALPRALRKRMGLPVGKNPYDNTGGATEGGAAGEALAEIPGYTPSPLAITDEQIESVGDKYEILAQKRIAADNAVTQNQLNNQQKVKQGEQQTDQQITKSAGNMYAKMTQAANLYGIAYQTMSNDNLSTSQKFQMMALQTAGQTAIAMLTTNWSKDSAQVAGSLPAILAECLKISPIAGAAIFAVLTGLLGGLMGVAVSKIAKHKAEISQATGAGGASAGKLTTGMLTYAEGNVNEFTDPASLTPGRKYNVDAADGRTYRARYMGANPKTHITNGPEFHLSGERGREMIIDAGTTRQITMNESGIWHAIQTLSGGGRITASRRRGRGVRAFADGNVDEFEAYETDGANGNDGTNGNGMTPEQMVALQSSLDRNNELLERALTEGIRGVFDVHGPGGLVNTYDKAKKEAVRHGERFT